MNLGLGKLGEESTIHFFPNGPQQPQIGLLHNLLTCYAITPGPTCVVQPQQYKGHKRD